MWFSTPPELRDRRGNRLYLNRAEQDRFRKASQALPETQSLFMDILRLAGPRISEVLELERNRVDLEAGSLIFRTLKRGGRKTYRYCPVASDVHGLDLPALLEALGIAARAEDAALCLRLATQQPERTLWREVPVPLSLLERLDVAFGISGGRDAEPLFPVVRSTASIWVKNTMRSAGIEGPQASAKGLRHSFGVNHALAGTQQAVLQRLMGHANPNMTARYMQVMDDELRAIVQKTWTEGRKPLRH